MQGIQDSKAREQEKGKTSWKKKQAGRKKRKNRKAIVTREGMILDNYGCIQGKSWIDEKSKKKRQGNTFPALIMVFYIRVNHHIRHISRFLPGWLLSSVPSGPFPTHETNGQLPFQRGKQSFLLRKLCRD